MGNLFELQGAFSLAEPVKKTIEWEQGGQSHKAEVYFKPLSWQTVYGAIEERESEQGDKSAMIARNLAASLCDENGKTLYTAQQIHGQDGKVLCTSLITALLIAMNEVNGSGKH